VTCEWQSKNLKTKCKAIRLEPFVSSSGQEEFHLKSQMVNTINARGHGNTLEEAKSDLESNIINLYPTEKV